MSKITIATAQYPIIQPQNWAAWVGHMSEWLTATAKAQPHLVVFPEYGSMALVGVLEPVWHQDLHGQIREMGRLLPDFLNFFQEWAQKMRCVIVAPSFPVHTEGGYVNRVFVFGSGGAYGHQDKWFMTRFESEDWGIQAPTTKELAVFETSWGRFGIQICYDVEFPIGSHILAKMGATLIVAPSCTETIRGATRVHVGARARALEQQCYTVVAQTIGKAEWSPAVDINYGQAAVYTTPDKDLPETGILAEKTPQEAGWLFADLDMHLIDRVRKEGQVFNFKDSQRQHFEMDNQTIKVSIIPI